MAVQRIEIETKAELADTLGEDVARRLAQQAGLQPQRVRRRAVYHLDLGLDPSEAAAVLEALVDPVAERGALGMLPDPTDDDCVAVTLGFRPGVTDAVGATVKRAAEDRLGRRLEGQCYSSTLLLVWGCTAEALEAAAPRVLFNPLIERAMVEPLPRPLDLSVPRAGTTEPPVVRRVPLRGLSDEALLELSRKGMLALNLEEMRAIARHFETLGRDPTDAELECLAQTWSEHCKHKIFAAPIDVVEPDGTVTAIEAGLFKTYIRGATEAVARARVEQGIEDAPFLVSVFHDNAGVVRCTDADHLVYKVETHNSPSALDPYGGAMTGIVGVNRDSFGTGLGADLLTNVWGYCFAAPDYAGPVPSGLMHPRRLREGVHRGVIDGGNHSGIPYSRGFELFDDRFLGKPLVFCGTVAVMPVERAGRPGHIKRVAVGDQLVMVGGRIGKDGIHGATFSSVELNEESPVQAVQIGDPITQKMMFDMLAEARDRGLMSGMTDNGAGGLSSSVGEMAEATNGARIDLAAAPLKYPGLQPWEILISEAQERMTIAVPPEHLSAFLDLARAREVEATVLGEFTDDGRLRVDYGSTPAVDLSLEFLHEGLPRVRLPARLSPRAPAEVAPEALEALTNPKHLPARWLELLRRPNLSRHADLARRYDHEVKGLSVIKPLVGVRRDVPSTATVMRIRHGRPEGVVLGEGIHPYVSDWDAFAMATLCLDEGVRRVLCAGARWDRLSALDNFCWPDPVLGPKTPDGEHKLAQLVACCRGLYEACIAFGVPLISGKDSMKNDATLEGRKISIPPTLLVSVMGQLERVDRSLSLVPRAEGDVLMLLDPAPVGLGASEAMRAGGLAYGDVPRADLARLAQAYRAFVEVRDRELVRSAHVCSRGGLAVALAHLVLASDRWLDVALDPWVDVHTGPFAALFSEGCGRIVFAVAPTDVEAVRSALEPWGGCVLGQVGAAERGGGVRVRLQGKALVELSGAELRRAYTSGVTDAEVHANDSGGRVPPC